MKTTAILVAVAMIAMATPTYAVETETTDLQALRAFTIEQAEKAGVDSVVLEKIETTAFAEAVAPLLAKADERGVSLADVLNRGEETGAFPQAGEHLELYEFALGSANACPAATAQPHPLPGSHPWSYGSPEFVGSATSDVSTISGVGIFFDYGTGKGFTYSQAVTYGGASDFFCQSIDFFGIFLTYNWPWMTGAVVDGL